MKKYIITVCDGASDLITNAEHIERNDELCESLGITDEYGDFDAAADAKKDGIKLIEDIYGIYNGFYIDSPQNRKLINEFLAYHEFSIDEQGVYSYSYIEKP